MRSFPRDGVTRQCGKIVVATSAIVVVAVVVEPVNLSSNRHRQRKGGKGIRKKFGLLVCVRHERQLQRRATADGRRS